jgi:hypothetical protein
MSTLLAAAPALYDAIFWASIALTSTVIAVYALTISLLGQAAGIARTAAARLRRSVTAEIERLKSGGTSAATLKQVERQLKSCRAELSAAARASRSIGLSSTVLIPGSLFLLAAVLARLSSHFTPAGAPPHPLWLLIVLPFAVGLLSVARVLRTIRSIVELSLPDLEVRVDPDPDPWRVGSWHRLRIRATLHRGHSLPTTQIVLFVPPSCDIQGEPIWTVSADDPLLPGFRAMGSRVWDYRPWAPFEWEFHHLQPRTKGPLTLYYAIFGSAYSSEPRPVRVNVQ